LLVVEKDTIALLVAFVLGSCLPRSSSDVVVMNDPELKHTLSLESTIRNLERPVTIATNIK
jgi:hypothetical protein